VRFLRLVAAIGVALVAGCGGDDGPASSAKPLTLEQARRADGTVRVRGWLVMAGDEVRLCSEAADSNPQLCAEPSVRVRGLDFVGVSNMEQGKRLGRSFAEVVLVGELEDGVLTVVQ